MISENDYRRMLWASRRGMLELDLVLAPFMEHCYRGLSPSDQATYRRLMECQDQELFGWFLGKEMPEDAELASLVERIVAFKRDPGAAGD